MTRKLGHGLRVVDGGSRGVRLRAAAAGLVAVLALVGCGDDPRAAARETFSKLADLKSGELTLELGIEPEGLDEGGPVGFRLSGPFRFRGGGETPDVRLRYEQLGNETPAEGTITVVDGKGTVATGETVRPLGPEQLDSLRAATGGGEGGGDASGLGLDLADWIEEPKTRDGEGETQEIEGRLDVRAALDDLLGASGAGGEISEQTRKRLAEATRTSSVRVVTGSEDRLLRRLVARAAIDVPEDIRGLVGGIERLRVDFDMRVERPNEPVEIRADGG